MAVERSTFCILPWIHLFIDVEGKFYPCTMAHDSDIWKITENGQPVTALTPSAIQKAWNSEPMKELRRQMTSGERPPICIRCFGIEDIGMSSYRERVNQQYLEDSGLPFPKISPEGDAEMDFRFVDIRLGNLCNLRCRMCSPHSTRNLIDEFKVIRPETSWDDYKKIDWFERQELWDDLLRHFDNVADLHFAGGEPLINKRKWAFLERLVNEGLSKNITITYNTNLTVLPQQAMNLWPHFKSIRLAVSVDAFGPLNDYIRYPSEWEKLVTHLETIDRDHRNLNIQSCEIHPVIQIYNILRLSELYQFVQRFDFISHYPRADFIVEPVCFDIQVMPPRLKNLARERLETFVASLNVNTNEPEHFKKTFTSHILGIIRHMDKKDRSDLIPSFARWTRIYDQNRKQSLGAVVPELLPMMSD